MSKRKVIGDTNSFTVKRSEWYRGKGVANSKLLNSRGKKCCLGFYAEACGIPSKEIKGQREPRDVPRYSEAVNWKSFLITSRKYNSKDSKELMMINDDKTITDKVRENKIKKIFAQYSIKVKFVN